MSAAGHGAAVRIEACGKTFADGTRALGPLDLAIAGGETVVFLGPSGCGKTTSLRLIAGLETPDPGGRVLFDGKEVTPLPVEKRNVGMVFQSYALFPNMNVARNVGYGLTIRGKPKAEIESRVAEMLAMMRIETLAGTTHRVTTQAEARALVAEIVEAYRSCRPVPPFNYVPRLLGRGGPRFEEVSSWDPRYHIQHLALPAGACYDDLLGLVADLHEPTLDRDRPLFRCWVIDGVPDGMFAIYTKVHHCLIDGESGLKYVYAGLSKSDRRTVPKFPFALGVSAPEPQLPAPLAAKVADSIRGAVTQVEALSQVSVGALRKTLAAVMGARLEGSVPFAAHRAPTNEPLKMGRGFGRLSLPLQEMQAIGRHFGATLNDVAVTIVDAGLHAYLRETGRAFAHPFISLCPVSLRAQGGPATGTRVSGMFVRLGESGATVTERIGQVVDSITTAKKELGGMSNDAAYTYALGLFALLGLAASTRLDRVGRVGCNLLISNVAGVREARYLNGARLVGIYPVSALVASIGLNVTLTSYDDSMDFGFVANPASVDDVPVLARHTMQAYQELKEAAGTQPTRPKRVPSRTTVTSSPRRQRQTNNGDGDRRKVATRMDSAAPSADAGSKPS